MTIRRELEVVQKMRIKDGSGQVEASDQIGGLMDLLDKVRDARSIQSTKRTDEA